MPAIAKKAAKSFQAAIPDIRRFGQPGGVFLPDAFDALGLAMLTI
jgi:hypothetical protein